MKEAGLYFTTVGRLIRFKREDMEIWVETQRQRRIDPGKAREIFRGVKRSEINIDAVVKETIEQARNTEYTSGHGKLRSHLFRAKLQEYGIRISMGGRSKCWDNAVVESFFKTLKAELQNDERFKTREEARAELFEYIEVFYNRKRLHSSLGYLSPAQFESNLPSLVSTKSG